MIDKATIVFSKKYNKHVEVPAGYGYCIDCDKVKPGRYFARSSTVTTGFYYYCKICHRAQKDPEVERARQILKKYGVTADQYDQMVKDSGNRCHICGHKENTIDYRTRKPIALAVDHCHDTGKVRGLLCRKCNTGIGLLGHDIDTLIKAIDYLANAGI